MVDSATTHYFISTVQLQQIEHENLHHGMTGLLHWGWQALTIVLADNSKVHAAKKVTLALQLGANAPCALDLFVVPRLNHPMILGMSWLRRSNPLIDWRTREVTLR